jgi:prophage antirepressor-like protein
MDILKSFILNETEYNINILWENEKPLFKANEIGKILDIKNIRSSIEDFDNDEKVVREIYYIHGGNQETLFLTETGLYRLLMRSNKPIARPFQKWISSVLISIREKGKYELKIKIDELEKSNEEKIKIAIDEEAKKYKKDLEVANHEALISAFRDKYVVYFGKIYDKDNDKFLLKIGSSKQIQIRSLSLNKQYTSGIKCQESYKSFNIFKVFEVSMNEMFEKFLHHHPNIVKYKYSEEIYDNYSSNGEVFLVTNEEAEQIIRIANQNKYKFSSNADIKKIIELEDLKLKQLEIIKNINDDTIKEIIKDNEENKIDPVIQLMDSRRYTQVRGDKIQRYSKDGNTLLETYESYSYAMRDKNLNNPTRSALKRAIENNTVYKEYRWINLKRELPDDTFQELNKTEKSSETNIGYIAMLNLDKTRIMNVFCDQKAAMEDRKFTSTASISNAMKKQTISSGHYFMLWMNCDEELKIEYLKNNNLPKKRINKTTIQVEQLHPITSVFIKKFTRLEDVVKEYRISRKTLRNACMYDLVLKGYKWRFT